MNKIPVNHPNRLLNHGSVILVSSQYQQQRSIITIAWHMPVSQDPAMLAISVGKSRFSHFLITESKEFVVNIPSWELLQQVKYCGTHTGKTHDKFTSCNFTPVNGKQVTVPLIQECFGNIECRLQHEYDAGDHTIFVGTILQSWCNNDILKNEVIDVTNLKTIHHLGGNQFAWLRL